VGPLRLLLKVQFCCRFEEDITVVPKASEWFGYYAIGDVSQLLPMQQQPIYTEDWIGLQELDKADKLVFQVADTSPNHSHLLSVVRSARFG
jgi:hypothetical protein